jgi:hypothetical protein
MTIVEQSKTLVRAQRRVNDRSSVLSSAANGRLISDAPEITSS